MDDFLSDSDDDAIESNNKHEQRADILIAKVASMEGCSYPAAMQKILDNPKWMEKAGVTKSKLKQFALEQYGGRDKLKRKLFEKTINAIGYQQQLRAVMELYFGSQLTLKRLVSDWSKYEWPFEIILLYIYQIGDFELEKIGDYSKSITKAEYDAKKLKFLFKEREMMKHVFVDNLLMSKNKDLRSYVLQCLEYILNKERNKKNKIFSLVYDKDRGSLVSDTNQVKENHIFNYNAKARQLRRSNGNNNNNNNGNSRQLVNIGISNSNSNSNSNDNNMSYLKKEFCGFHNSHHGCRFGKHCQRKNVCIECGNDKHGATSCYRIGKLMIENGTIQRIMERRNGVSRHDPRNGVIIGCDGRNYYLNNFNNNNNNNQDFGHNWGSNNHNNNNGRNNNGNRNNNNHN